MCSVIPQICYYTRVESFEHTITETLTNSQVQITESKKFNVEGTAAATGLVLLSPAKEPKVTSPNFYATKSASNLQQGNQNYCSLYCISRNSRHKTMVSVFDLSKRVNFWTICFQ